MLTVTPIGNSLVMRGRNETLETALIEQRLGRSIKSLKELPPEKAKHLMTDASMYASLKLAEIDAKGGLAKNLHNLSIYV